MESAREFFNQRINIVKDGDEDIWIDPIEADSVLADYDRQYEIPVVYKVVIHAAYRDAALTFDSPWEATNFLRMWAEHLEFNEDNSFSVSMEVCRIDESEDRE